MREHSGTDGSTTDGRDPTLRDHQGEGGPGTRPGDFTEGASFAVAADHQAEGGARSPSARGRGEVDDDREVVPSGE